MENLSARLHGPKDLRLEKLPIPKPGPGHVQLKPAFVGICGTDIHFYDYGERPGLKNDAPWTLGHEASAVVSGLGEGVTGLKVGDRVAVDPVQPCGDCRFCREQRVEVCDRVQLLGVNVNGGFSKYMVSQAEGCYRIPDHVSLEEATCAEPLSVVVWALLHRGRMAKDEAVVIFGVGSIGLLTLQTARARGAKRVLVVDIKADRLELAKSLGADICHLVTNTDMGDTQKLAETLKGLLGCEPDLVMECSAAPEAVDTALLLCRKAGRVVLVGIGAAKLEVHLGLAALREVEVIGSLRNNKNYPEAIDLLASGKVKATPLITNKIPLERIQDAIELFKQGEVVKVIIDCQK